MTTMCTIGATTGDTLSSPYQAGCDPNGENAAWAAEVESKGYIRCQSDGMCGCQGQRFGIVYHSPEHLEELQAEDDLRFEAVGIALGTLAVHLSQDGQDYRQFFAAFADAKRWDWNPDDPRIADAFTSTSKRPHGEER
jgi:hypothetical protein